MTSINLKEASSEEATSLLDAILSIQGIIEKPANGRPVLK